MGGIIGLWESELQRKCTIVHADQVVMPPGPDPALVCTIVHAGDAGAKSRPPCATQERSGMNHGRVTVVTIQVIRANGPPSTT